VLLYAPISGENAVYLLQKNLLIDFIGEKYPWGTGWCQRNIVLQDGKFFILPLPKDVAIQV
jgi:hypothetical protein